MLYRVSSSKCQHIATHIRETKSMSLKKTCEVVELLGVKGPRLRDAIQNQRIAPPPGKDPSGHFVWTDADIERARIAISTDLRRRSSREGAPCQR